MLSFMGQNVLLASRKEFHVHEWEEEGGRELGTENLLIYEGKTRRGGGPHERGRKFHTTIKLSHGSTRSLISDSTYTSHQTVYLPELQKLLNKKSQIQMNKYATYLNVP